MTDISATKVKALELANQHAAPPAEIVARATAYAAFLNNGPQAVNTGGAGAAAGGKPAGTATNAGTGTGAKAGDKPAGTKPTDKPAGTKPADKPAGAAGKPNGAAGAAGKPNGAAGAAAGKPAAAGAPTGAAVANDTKAPNGKFTYADVSARLRSILNSTEIAEADRRPTAQAVLQDVGGVKSIRDLPPAKYDAVVAAADKVLADAANPPQTADAEDPLGDPPEHTGSGETVEDPTAQAPRDDLGL